MPSVLAFLRRHVLAATSSTSPRAGLVLDLALVLQALRSRLGKGKVRETYRAMIIMDQITAPIRGLDAIESDPSLGSTAKQRNQDPVGHGFELFTSVGKARIRDELRMILARILEPATTTPKGGAFEVHFEVTEPGVRRREMATL